MTTDSNDVHYQTLIQLVTQAVDAGGYARCRILMNVPTYVRFVVAQVLDRRYISILQAEKVPQVAGHTAMQTYMDAPVYVRESREGDSQVQVVVEAALEEK